MDPALASLKVSEDTEDFNGTTLGSEELVFSIVRRTLTTFTDEESELKEDELEENEENREYKDTSSSQKQQKRPSMGTVPIGLPDPLSFENIILHPEDLHQTYANLSTVLPANEPPSASSIFALFFSESVLKTLAKSTNAYAARHVAEAMDGSRQSSDTSAGELRVLSAFSFTWAPSHSPRWKNLGDFRNVSSAPNLSIHGTR
ncbi:hypothetical protein BGW38_003329 [Lunasporangiospora selenospora]|uniref:Uncharacterized protein n=1 Tax=Lunasporangiospora selenospora TaxID=979761 RepID=A0A9P6FSX5_9FUNG|nr:hypothetical protein BGW38_003329 [Lunasporangiospora selenospora]